jgi:hypothetical protein
MILNMFRASLCSSSGGQLYICSIWYPHALYAAIQRTDQVRTQSGLSPLLIGALYGSIQSVRIPDTANIRGKSLNNRNIILKCMEIYAQ